MNSRIIKIIAIVTMTVDHVGAVLFPQYVFLRCIGRIAMPLFCFLIAYGCTKTRSLPKYILRLTIFALISQIPFSLALMGTITFGFTNVFVTLAFGALACWFIEFGGKGDKFPIKYLGIAVTLTAAAILNCDYGIAGVLLIIGFYVALKYSQKPNTTPNTPQKEHMSIEQQNQAALSLVQNMDIALTLAENGSTQENVIALQSVEAQTTSSASLRGTQETKQSSAPNTAAATPPNQPNENNNSSFLIRHSLFVLSTLLILMVVIFNAVLVFPYYAPTYQWYSMFAALFLLFFADRKLKFSRFEKWAFYVYYPLHLLILYGLGFIV